MRSMASISSSCCLVHKVLTVMQQMLRFGKCYSDVRGLSRTNREIMTFVMPGLKGAGWKSGSPACSSLRCVAGLQLDGLDGSCSLAVQRMRGQDEGSLIKAFHDVSDRLFGWPKR